MRLLLVFMLSFSFIANSFSQVKNIVRNFHEEYGIPEEDLFDFGRELKVISDLNGDGINEMAFTATRSNATMETSLYQNGVYVAYTNSEGRFDSIHHLLGDIYEDIPDSIRIFSPIVEELGDIDGDGIPELIARLSYRELESGRRSHLAVLYLDNYGNLVKHKSLYAEDFNLAIENNFGSTLSNLGDMNNDGRDEIAIQYVEDNLFQINIFSLDSDGDVYKSKKLETGIDTYNGSWGWGYEIKGGHDLNGDGTKDILVGAPHWGFYGKVAVLYMNSNIDLVDFLIIDENNFEPKVGEFIGDVHFGTAISILGDINNDSKMDILITTSWNEDLIEHAGVLHIFSLNNDGTLFKHISMYEMDNPILDLQPHDHFGDFMDVIPDLDEDGLPEIVIVADTDFGPGYIATFFSDYENFFNLFTTSIEDKKKEFAYVHIYPNPVENQLFIESEGFEIKEFTIYNQIGQRVLHSHAESKNNSVKVSELPSGLYWLHLRNADSFATRQFSKL